jgi:hypothetical protein
MSLWSATPTESLGSLPRDIPIHTEDRWVRDGRRRTHHMTRRQWEALGEPDLVQDWTDAQNYHQSMRWWLCTTVQARLSPTPAQGTLF